MRRMILASAAVAAVLVLAGCSAAGSSSSSSGGSSGGVPQPAGPGSEPFVPGDTSRDGLGQNGTAEGGAADGSSSTGSTSAGQSVITTGWITVTVDDPIAATEQAVALVASVDGRIDSRTEQAGSDEQRSSSQLTIRVPADSVDQTIEKLKEFGSVDSVSLSSNDVTLQVKDLDAQIGALQASVDRLLQLVGSASSTADLIELETAISDRQGQLDSLKSQKQYLADQIDYSTITLDLVQKGALPSNAPGDFWSGLATGWASLTAALTGFVVLVGVLIPWLLPLAVIAAVVIAIVLLTRRRDARRPAGARPPQATPGQPGAAQPGQRQPGPGPGPGPREPTAHVPQRPAGR